MDRTRTPWAFDGAPVRPERIGAFQLLLPAAGPGERRESAVDASDRRAVLAPTVLRIAAPDPLAARVGLDGQREAGGATDARDGAASGGAGATHQPPAAAASDLSVPAARGERGGARRSVVCRHHVRADALRVSVP